MIRLLLALVIVGLTLALVVRTLKQSPVATDSASSDSAAVEIRSAVQEAEQVKALVEQQQELLQQRADARRQE